MHARPPLTLGLLLALAACAVPGRPAPPAALGFAPYSATYRGGVVATSEPQPAEAAAAVLAQGGNAVDAAAVAAFVLNVVEPQSSGIGGGGFMMIHLAATGETIVVDSRETAPTAATPDQFLTADGAPQPFALASTAGLAVGVPGMLRGIDEALARYGTLSLADALAPAIAVAEAGIIVDARLAESTRDRRLETDCAGAATSAYAAARAIFRGGGEAGTCGAPLSPGARLVQPDLARTMRAIAAGGADAFYDCDHPAGIARAIVEAQRTAPAEFGPPGEGRMTCADLAGYRAVVRQPVAGSYRGWVVRSTPPPSSGGIALLQMLTMLERFPLGDPASGFGFGAAGTLTVMQEAMRLAFADRARWVGDPDRARWVGDADRVEGLPMAGLVSAAYLSGRAASCPDGDADDADYCIRPDARLTGIRPGDPRPFEAAGAGAAPVRLVATNESPQQAGDTTHLSVADRWGNVVSYTTSIEAPWGTGLMVDGHGFLLNNQLTDFNLQPSRNGDPGDPDFDPGANDVAPGKRPRSSMAPSMIFAHTADGERPVAAFGSPGGASIINTMVNVSVDLIDYRLPISAAVERPRLSLTKAADDATTHVEPGFDAAVLESLEGLGYRFAVAPPLGIGAVQAVVIDPRTRLLQADADPRRHGMVEGVAQSATALRR